MVMLEEFIFSELKKRKPARVLLWDEGAQTLANRFLETSPDTMLCKEGSPGIDFVLIGNALASLNQQQAIQLLARLLRLSPVLLTVADKDSPLGFNDFISLGMQRLHGPDSGQQCVFGFDLHTYKPAPDWLNPKYWAHPERWKP